MPSNSETLHEADLPAAVIDRHRAIVSIMEELEAVDWYDQRVAATDDPELAEVLGHNRDEEKEHAAMTLEWLRRHDAKWDEVLHTYLFTEAPIVEVEHLAEAAASADDPASHLAVGDLRKEQPR
ncbi:MAG: encapsulin-associated ferritin-like protein [Acidimicrobiales bacterium]